MSRELPIGTILENRYEVLSYLNEGGTSRVYLARRLGIDREVMVAVKELRSEIVTRGEFRNEVSLLFSLSHPNLPKVYDFFESGGQYYLVTEYVDGKTLAELVQEQGPLMAAEAREVGIELANVFAYLHSQHVLHRDLKPQNVMLDADGRVKVIDFGIAKSATDEGVFAYSEGTSAPEQRISGQSDERSDIYSLGATLYYILTGRYPGELIRTPVADGKTIKRDPALPAELEPIIRRCLASKPEERYQTMDEVLAAIESAEPTAAVQGSARHLRWLRWLLPAGAAVVALILLLVPLVRRAVAPAPPPAPPPVAYTITVPSEILANSEFSVGLQPTPPGAVTWELYDAAHPERLLQLAQGSASALSAPGLGVYRLVAKSGDKQIAVKDIAVAADFSARKSVVQGYQHALRPSANGSTSGTPLTWEWVFTDPLGRQSVEQSESGLVRHVFGEIGVNRVQLVAVYTLKDGSQMRAAGPEKVVEVVRDSGPPNPPVNPNPGFEEGLAGWTLVGKGELAQGVAFSGKNSVKFSGPADGKTTYATEQFLLISGGRYIASFRVRGRAVSGWQQIELRFRSTTTDEYLREPVKATEYFAEDFDWQKVEVSFEAPAQPHIVEVYLRFSGKGTVWFDACYISPR